MRVIFMFLCVIMAALGAVAQTPPEKRVAVIIAQQNYTNGWGALPIVAQDRSLMTTALRNAGFEVTIAENLQSKDALQNTLVAFANKLDSPDGKSIGFIYYSGHGAADGGGRDARNYLIPTGTAMTTKPELVARALSLDDALEPVLAANTAAIFVALDACRNYPDAFSKSGVKGLAPVAVRPRMLIGFATQPGDTAPADGRYAQVLAQQIARPGVSGDQVFSDTQFEVARQTNEQQRPANYNNLTRKIVLSTKSLSGAAPSPAPPATQPSFDPRQVEVSFWESIKTSKNKADFEAYLRRFPNGIYADLAKGRLSNLLISLQKDGSMSNSEFDPLFRGITVKYYRRQADGDSVIKALQKNRIPFKVHSQQLASTWKTNAVACGSGYKIDAVKKIVYALMDAGFEVKSIYPFRNPDAKRKTIEILAYGHGDWSNPTEPDDPPLTRDQIKALTRCP